jgi:hypothetical protein
MSWRRANPVCLALVTFFSLSAFGTDRVRLVPKFSPGQTVRYRIESSSKSTGKTTSPIVNPEGGSQSSDSVHMVVRLEVLNVSPDGSVRLRAIYEKSFAESQADALDLTAGTFASRYNRLEGRTFEFTLDISGKVTGVQDLTAAAAGQSPKAIDPALSWIQNISSIATLPKEGIAIGQKWKTERPVEGAILSGLVTRGESTYLHNEPCGTSPASSADGPADAAKPAAVAPADDCAVILTQFEITRRGSARSDATPDDFRRNGLRTSGAWAGSGESLDSFSLATGLLVSSTQSSTENMDYQITSANTGSTIRHTGKVQSQSQITLATTQP